MKKSYIPPKNRASHEKMGNPMEKLTKQGKQAWYTEKVSLSNSNGWGIL